MQKKVLDGPSSTNRTPLKKNVKSSTTRPMSSGAGSLAGDCTSSAKPRVSRGTAAISTKSSVDANGRRLMIRKPTASQKIGSIKATPKSATNHESPELAHLKQLVETFDMEVFNSV